MAAGVMPKVVPLGLNIPVGWRQPSYKKLKVPEDLKIIFIFENFQLFVIPLGFKPKTFRTGI